MDIREAQQVNILPEQRHPWERARLEVVYHLLCKIFSEPQEKPLIILDIGCGDAFVIGELAKRMPLSKFIAVDAAFNDELLPLLNRQYQETRIEFHAVLNDIELPNEKVDLVLLLDVLEHIEKDSDFLHALVPNKHFGTETRFLITAPAFQSLFSAHDLFLKHYRRYNNRTLKKCLLASGLKIHGLGYFFSSLLLPRVIKVLLGKISRPSIENEKGIGAWKPHRLRDGWIIKLLVFDFTISEALHRFGIKLPGLSNYALCQKRLS